MIDIDIIHRNMYVLLNYSLLYQIYVPSRLVLSILELQPLHDVITVERRRDIYVMKNSRGNVIPS